MRLDPSVWADLHQIWIIPGRHCAPRVQEHLPGGIAWWYCANCPSHNINQLNSHAVLRDAKSGERCSGKKKWMWPQHFSLAAKAVWVSGEMLMKMRFLPPTVPAVRGLLLSLLWRSRAHSFCAGLIGMNAPFGLQPYEAGVLRQVLLPLAPHWVAVGGDWWRRLLKCVWGSPSWSCPALRRLFPLTGRRLGGAPNWTVRTGRAVWYITVDADAACKPAPAPPPLSCTRSLPTTSVLLHGTPEALMKICGHFGAPLLA